MAPAAAPLPPTPTQQVPGQPVAPVTPPVQQVPVTQQAPQQVDGIIPTQNQQTQNAPTPAQQAPQPAPAKKGFSLFGKKKEGVDEKAIEEAVIKTAYDVKKPVPLTGTELSRQPTPAQPVPQPAPAPVPPTPSTQQVPGQSVAPVTPTPTQVPKAPKLTIPAPTPPTPVTPTPTQQVPQPAPSTAPLTPPFTSTPPAPVTPTPAQPVPQPDPAPVPPVAPEQTVPVEPVAQTPPTPTEPTAQQTPVTQTPDQAPTQPTTETESINLHTQQSSAPGVFDLSAPKTPLSQQPREVLEAVEKDSQKEEELAGEATRELDDVLASQFAQARELQLKQLATTPTTPPAPAPEELQNIQVPQQATEQQESLPPVIQPKEDPPHVIPVPQTQPVNPAAPVATPPAPTATKTPDVNNLISSLQERKDEINKNLNTSDDEKVLLDSSNAFGSTKNDDGPPDIWELASMRKSGKPVSAPKPPVTPAPTPAQQVPQPAPAPVPPVAPEQITPVEPVAQTPPVPTEPAAQQQQVYEVPVSSPEVTDQEEQLPVLPEEPVSPLDEITYDDPTEPVADNTFPEDVPSNELSDEPVTEQPPIVEPQPEVQLETEAPVQESVQEEVIEKEPVHLEIQNVNTSSAQEPAPSEPENPQTTPEPTAPTSNLEALRQRAHKEGEVPANTAGANNTSSTQPAPQTEERPKPKTTHAKAISNIADKLNEISNTTSLELPSIKSIIDGDVDTETAKQETKGTGTKEGDPNKPQENMGVPLVRTFRNDVEQAVVKNKTSVVDMLESEKSRDYGETVRKAKHSNSSATISLVLVWASAILILGAIAFGAFVLFKFFVDGRSSDTPEIISPNETIPHDITDQTKEEILEGITGVGATSQASQGIITELQIIEGSAGQAIGTQGTRIVETYSFFEKLNTNAPSALIRSTDEDMALGFHKLAKSESFWVFKITDFEAASGGMYEWEDTLRKDLSPFFGREVEIKLPAQTTEAGNTATTGETEPVTVPTAQKPIIDVYEDATIANVPARCLKGTGETQDVCIVLWSMPDKETVVITSSAETLQALISRMKSRS